MKTAAAICAALIFAAAGPAAAFHEAAFGIDSVQTAAENMAGNPPLPMLRWREGTWRVTPMPAFFFGGPEADDSSAGRFDTGGDFRGFGGGVSLSYALADRWGAYGWALGAVSRGDFHFTEFAGCGGGGCVDTRMNGVRSSFALVSAGVAYQALGDLDEGFALPVFAGPAVAFLDSSQEVVRTQAGAVTDDFDMEVSDVSPGLIAGAQAAVPLGKSWTLNPFVLAGWFFGDECRTYDVSAIRVNGTLDTQSTPDCGGPTGTNPAGTTTRQIGAGLSGAELAGGINLAYVPWGLSVNLTAPFLQRVTEAGEARMTLLTFSLNFGNYSNRVGRARQQR